MTDQTPDAAREDEELRTNDGELRMSAYYYVFDKTGVVEVDRILAAVAYAGKGCHNTADWSEFDYPELIQQWANKAAKAFRDAAAVSRSRDAAWREGLAAAIEKVPRFRMVRQVKSATGYSVQMTHHDERRHHNEPKAVYLPDVIAALDALLARMDTTGGANG